VSRKKRPAGQPWQPMAPATLIRHELPEHLRHFDIDEPRSIWMNDRYVAQVIDHPDGITEISIRRTDREWPRDWRHFQRIKNELVGPEREACELFPRESRLVDGANQFHLFVLPKGMDFPFGYWHRGVANGDEPILKGIGGKQRPLDK
jgi:hypothetical protein